MRAHGFAQIRKGWSAQQISDKLVTMPYLINMPDTDEPAAELAEPARDTVSLNSVSHETIYRAIYVLSKGELRKQIIGLLRQGRKLRRARVV